MTPVPDPGWKLTGPSRFTDDREDRCPDCGAWLLEDGRCPEQVRRNVEAYERMEGPPDEQP